MGGEGIICYARSLPPSFPCTQVSFPLPFSPLPLFPPFSSAAACILTLLPASLMKKRQKTHLVWVWPIAKLMSFGTVLIAKAIWGILFQETLFLSAFSFHRSPHKLFSRRPPANTQKNLPRLPPSSEDKNRVLISYKAPSFQTNKRSPPFFLVSNFWETRGGGGGGNSRSLNTWYAEEEEGGRFVIITDLWRRAAAVGGTFFSLSFLSVILFRPCSVPKISRSRGRHHAPFFLLSFYFTKARCVT